MPEKKINIEDNNKVEVFLRRNDPRRAIIPIVRVNARRIRFATGAIRLMDIDGKSKLAVFRIGKLWFVAKSKDPDAYPVSVVTKGGKTNGLCINASQLSRMINIDIGFDCILVKSDRYDYKGNIVYELQNRIG